MKTIDDRVRVTPGIDTLFRVWVGDAVVLATDDMEEAGQRAREERYQLLPRHVRIADRLDSIGRRVQRVSIGVTLIGLGLVLAVFLVPLGILPGLVLAWIGGRVIRGGRS